MSAVWDLDVFIFAFLLIKLIRYFHILVIKLEYLQVVTQEARKLFTGRQESTQGSNPVFDSLIFFCLDSDCLVYFLDIIYGMYFLKTMRLYVG